LYGVSLGKFDAEVCNSCNEKFFGEKASDEIDKIAKQKGLWGLEAETTIGKAGDSLIVRINKQLATFFKLKKGGKIRIRPEDERHIIIEI
jgi:hypothetical protein